MERRARRWPAGWATEHTSSVPTRSCRCGQTLGVSSEEIAAAYWASYESLLDGGGDSGEWASELVDAAVRGDIDAIDRCGNDVVAMLVLLAERAPDDLARAFLGAGPVEELLGRADPPVDEVESAARRSAEFRFSLRCAWFEERLSATDAARLRAFGPPP